MRSIKESDNEKTQVTKKTTRTASQCNRFECLGNNNERNDETSEFEAVVEKR